MDLGPVRLLNDMVLLTKRCELRPIAAADADQLHHLWSSAGVRRFLTWHRFGSSRSWLSVRQSGTPLVALMPCSTNYDVALTHRKAGRHEHSPGWLLVHVARAVHPAAHRDHGGIIVAD
jgi:hypothetical protein